MDAWVANELRGLIDYETRERAKLEKEVIEVAAKLDTLAGEVRSLAGRLNTFEQKTYERLDKIIKHIGA